MALTTEATIALIALFVACVPGLRFIISYKHEICQWWSRDRTGLLRCEGPENPHPTSAPSVENHPLPLDASDCPPNDIYQLGSIYSFVQRFQSSSRRTLPQRLEAGLLFYTQTINTDHLEENEPLTGDANDGDNLPVMEQHRQP